MKELADTKKTIGLDSTLRELHQGKIKEIVIASNCPEDIEDRITSAAKIYKIPVTKANVDNQRLGVLCKKTFNISVVGILKEE